MDYWEAHWLGTAIAVTLIFTRICHEFGLNQSITRANLYKIIRKPNLFLSFVLSTFGAMCFSWLYVAYYLFSFALDAVETVRKGISMPEDVKRDLLPFTEIALSKKDIDRLFDHINQKAVGRLAELDAKGK